MLSFMNPIYQFIVEMREGRRIERGLKIKLSDLEEKRLHHSPDELRKEMGELFDLEYQAKAFNKGLFFCKEKIPYAINLIPFEPFYADRISLLKANLGYAA
jgi:hypothetical protein